MKVLKYGITHIEGSDRAKNLPEAMEQSARSIVNALDRFNYTGADPNLVLARVAHLESLVLQDTGWLPMITEGTGTTPMGGAEAPMVRMQGRSIHFRGGITNNGIAASTNTNRLRVPDQIARLMPTPSSGAAVSSNAAAAGVWIISVNGIFNLRTPPGAIGAYFKIDSVPPILVDGA